MFLIEHAQLPVPSNNFKNEIASSTEKGTEKYDKTDELWNHKVGFISYLIHFDANHKRLILNNYEVLANDSGGGYLESMIPGFSSQSSGRWDYFIGRAGGCGYNRQEGVVIMIDEKSVLDLRDRIAAEFRPQRIILFGSYAHGNPGSDSDLDVLVILGNGGSGPKKAAEILSRLNPRIPVDLVVRTSEEVNSRLQANDFFLAEILNHGRVLYEAPNP